MHAPAPPVLEPVQGEDPGQRWLGGVAGGLLGLAAAGVVYLVLRVPAIAGLGLVDALLGPQGLFAQMGVWSLLVWATGPVAAALTGWWLAPRAIAEDAWGGVTMGFVTYLVGVAIGPVVVFGPTTFLAGPDGLAPSLIEAGISWLISAVFLTMVGGVLLYPLLAVALPFGVAWARLTRSLATASGVAAPRTPRPLPIGSLTASIVFLGVVWIGCTVLLLGLGGEGWVD